MAMLQLAAHTIGTRRLDLGPQGGSLTFEEKNSVDPNTVIRMIQKSPKEYRLEGPLKLRIHRQMPTEAARFELAADLLKRLRSTAQ
jgi:transcription-repair coupling factor (superfamily II helicase)